MGSLVLRFRSSWLIWEVGANGTRPRMSAPDCVNFQSRRELLHLSALSESKQVQHIQVQQLTPEVSSSGTGAVLVRSWWAVLPSCHTICMGRGEDRPSASITHSAVHLFSLIFDRQMWSIFLYCQSRTRTQDMVGSNKNAMSIRNMISLHIELFCGWIWGWPITIQKNDWPEKKTTSCLKKSDDLHHKRTRTYVNLGMKAVYLAKSKKYQAPNISTIYQPSIFPKVFVRNETRNKKAGDNEGNDPHN